VTRAPDAGALGALAFGRAMSVIGSGAAALGFAAAARRPADATRSSGLSQSRRMVHAPHSRPRQRRSKRACAASSIDSLSVTMPISKLRRPSPFAPSPAPVRFALPR
jgi:hypothetical protein